MENIILDVSSLVAQTVKRLPAMRKTGVRFLGQEDPLEKEMAVHSSILAWNILWMEEPDRLQSMGSQESDITERLSIAQRSCGSFSVNIGYHID